MKCILTTLLAILFGASSVEAIDLSSVSKACDDRNANYNKRFCIRRVIESIAEESYSINVEAQEIVNEQLFKSITNDTEIFLNELEKIKIKETLRLVLMEFNAPVSDSINLNRAKIALLKAKGDETLKKEIIRNIGIAVHRGGKLSIEIDWGFSGKRIKGIQGEKKDSIEINNYEYQQEIPYLLKGFNRTTDIKIEIIDESNKMEDSILLGALKSNCYKIKKEGKEIISEIISCTWD